MVPAHPASRSVVRSTLLALVLAVATVAVAVGRDAATDTASTGGLGGAGRTAPVVDSSGWVDPEPAPRYDTDIAAARVAVAPAEVAAAAVRAYEAHEVQAAPAATKAKTDTASPARFRGRNHVWMPALRIDRSISFYSCSTTSYPGNRVYRWGCAGSDNVYLFGHAGGVFKPLHDAYVAGRLRKGMPLYYADGSGTLHTYRIAWWKLTTPTAGTWAYASQTRPSLTLQTCIGAQSQYRLIVRLIEVG